MDHVEVEVPHAGSLAADLSVFGDACEGRILNMTTPSVSIEAVEPEREALRLAAIHLASMILRDASVGGTAQNGAMLDLENAALRYVRRLDAVVAEAREHAQASEN
jgi:hypothetical protein